jgi:hypothetical protein
VTGSGDCVSPSHWIKSMSYSQVRYEAHTHAATIYVTGMLEPVAAARAVLAIGTVHDDVRTIRVDLRAVSYVEPDCFVRVARALSAWHDGTRGQITIAFPSQSEVSMERRSNRTATILRVATPADESADRSSEVSARLSPAAP